MPESAKRRRSRRSVPGDGSGAADASDSYEALQRRLADSLVMLRAEFREAIESYAVQVQGMVTQAADAIADEGGALSPGQRRDRAGVLRQALKGLDGLDVKPTKGRRKDLKRIEKFVANLCDTIADW